MKNTSAISSPPQDPLLTPSEAAERLHVSPATLAVWRSTKRYDLRFVKIGSKVLYRASAIENFINAREVRP